MIAAVASIAPAACASKPDAGEAGHETTARHEAGHAAAPASATAASAPVSARDDEAERFTFDQIAIAIHTLTRCTEQDERLSGMWACACRADVALSRRPVPADVAVHCAAYADAAAAYARRPEEEQKRSPYLLAAPDVAPGSLAIFAYTAPCLIEAHRQKSTERAQVCLCRAHAVANHMARFSPTTGLEFAAALERADREVAASGRCSGPTPSAPPPARR